jgi:hypothetical protein
MDKICRDQLLWFSMHYRNFTIHRRPKALGVSLIVIGVVYAESCPRRRCSSADLYLTIGVASVLGVVYADGFVLGVAPSA